MEYKILEVTESASVEELNRALRRIRARYHPDKGNSSEAGRKLVELAEEAHRRILKQRQYNGAVDPVFDDSVLSMFQGMRPFAMSPPSVQPRRRSVHESSYSYSNVNGQVKESGRINGRPMEESEMKHFRPSERTGWRSGLRSRLQ